MKNSTIKYIKIINFCKKGTRSLRTKRYFLKYVEILKDKKVIKERKCYKCHSIYTKNDDFLIEGGRGNINRRHFLIN